MLSQYWAELPIYHIYLTMNSDLGESAKLDCDKLKEWPKGRQTAVWERNCTIFLCNMGKLYSMGVLNINSAAVPNPVCQTVSASKPDWRKHIFTAALEAEKWLTWLSSPGGSLYRSLRWIPTFLQQCFTSEVVLSSIVKYFSKDPFINSSY